MTDLFRILVVIFLVMHGIGHIIWFLGAWTTLRVGVRDGAWILPGNVTLRSPLGRIWGLLALLALVLFVTAGVALLRHEDAWRQLANTGVIVSFFAVVPWLRRSPGSTALIAIIANLVLMFLLALPLSVELTSTA